MNIQLTNGKKIITRSKEQYEANIKTFELRGFVPVDEHGYTIQENHEDINFGGLVEKTTWLSKQQNGNVATPPPPGGAGNGKMNMGKFTSADYADVNSFSQKYRELSKAGEHKAASELEKKYYESKK